MSSYMSIFKQPCKVKTPILNKIAINNPNTAGSLVTTTPKTLITPTSVSPQAAQLVDELTTCWAMISFAKCASLSSDKELSVQLYYGSIYDPQPLDTMYKSARQATPIASMFKSKERPMLTFRVGPLTCLPPPMVPYA